MKKAIVTGANGFIGQWLVKELVDNNVYVYAVVKDKTSNINNIKSKNNLEIVYCDIKNISNLELFIKDRKIENFYHLAWIGCNGTLKADYKIQLNNVQYTCDAAIIAKKLGCKRFLAAGTITERISENIFNTNSFSKNMAYGAAKYAAHLMLDVLCKTIDINYIWMRFSNVYGPDNRTGNLICYALNEITNNRRPSFSKGEQPYDFIYIKDLVKAVRLLGEKELKHNSYFLGSGSKRLLKDYLLDIPKIIDGNAQVGIGERPEDGLVYNDEWFDINELIEDTSFQPKYSFEDGIKETLKWLTNESK